MFNCKLIKIEFKSLIRLSRDQKIFVRYKNNFSSTLLDSFGRKHDYLRISLTERCNLRCQYCMPEEGIKLTKNNNLLSTEEIKILANIFVEKFKIKKIRLTGGEPLLRKDIIQIVDYLNSNLRPIGLENIAITTNGTILKRNCESLKKAGLDAVNISLDSLIPVKYEFITRRPNSFKLVYDGILKAIDQNFRLPIKINCVVIKGFNEDEIINFVEFTKDKPIEVRFIEYMPFDGNQWKNNKLFSYKKMFDLIYNHYGENLKQVLNTNESETSKSFKISGYEGRIGFITSMTNNFCSTCNRLRITADGNLKVCLFDQNEVSLRDELRKNKTDNFDLIEIIKAALFKKKAKHSGAEAISQNKNRPMILIGVNTNDNFKENKTLSHINQDGQLNMVDVSNKSPSKRKAISSVKIKLGKDLFEKIKLNQIEKGDILTVAKIAGIQASKKTSDLIPLCHQLNIEKVDVKINMIEHDHSLKIISTVNSFSNTGVEMESIICSAIAAITIYDMGKAINKEIKITDLHLNFKSGGKKEFLFTE